MSALALLTQSRSLLGSSRCFSALSASELTSKQGGDRVSASIQCAAAFRDEHVEREAKLEGSRLARPRERQLAVRWLLNRTGCGRPSGNSARTRSPKTTRSSTETSPTAILPHAISHMARSFAALPPKFSCSGGGRVKSGKALQKIAKDARSQLAQINPSTPTATSVEGVDGGRNENAICVQYTV